VAVQLGAIRSQKGGTCEATRSARLAVRVRLAGDRALVVDFAPQGSLAPWWNARELPGPDFARTALGSLEQDLGRPRTRGFRYLSLDTPPATSAAIARVVRFAHLILLATRPSPQIRGRCRPPSASPRRPGGRSCSS